MRSRLREAPSPRFSYCGTGCWTASIGRSAALLALTAGPRPGAGALILPRVIVRREAPGRPRSFTDHDGDRFQDVLTGQTPTSPLDFHIRSTATDYAEDSIELDWDSHLLLVRQVRARQAVV